MKNEKTVNEKWKTVNEKWKTVNEKWKNDQIRFHEALRNIENGTRKVAGRMKKHVTYNLLERWTVAKIVFS